MMPSLRSLRQKLGKLGIVFVALLAVYGVVIFVASKSLIASLFLIALYITGVALVFRIFRASAHKILWRLRNRLIVAYVFIAVVPIVLILILVAIGAYFLTGQIATYLVNSELERRAAMLAATAHSLSQMRGNDRRAGLERAVEGLQDRFPGLEAVLRNGTIEHYPPSSQLAPPPAGWKSDGGVVVKDGHWYNWAHFVNDDSSSTLIVPLTQDFLDSLVPHLAKVSINLLEDRRNGRRITLQPQGSERKTPSPDDGPPAFNRFDVHVSWFNLISCAFWDQPGKHQTAAMMVRTRPSAVLDAVSGQRVEIAFTFMLIFLCVAGLFLIVEVVSLFIGVSLSRTITGAVHDLYIATQKVKEGDFSHRIIVRGHDQLTELSHSFNGMTENLGRLVVVEKRAAENAIRANHRARGARSTVSKGRARRQDFSPDGGVPSRSYGVGRLL